MTRNGVRPGCRRTARLRQPYAPPPPPAGMCVPCVSVERERGEAVRRRLDEAGALDREHEIAVADGLIHIPVEPSAVPGDLRDHLTEQSPDRRRRQRTPADLLGSEPSLERLGGIVILDEDDPDRAREVADAVMRSDLPAETVVNRASPVAGRERVRDWTVLAGDGTETTHREYGFEFRLDIAEVFFSPRLATERRRVVETVEPGERAFDMFAGVGPYAIPMAARGATVVAYDVNDRAIDYLRGNARRNGVADRVTAVTADVRTAVGEYADWADRIVMNLPHSADEFLETAVALAGEEAVVHYYDIQHEDDPFGPGEAAIRAAASGGDGPDSDPDADASGYAVAIEDRRVVRSYAPHELNVRIDARLTRR